MHAFIVVGLGFGDEGKGATVDALVRRAGARVVVRYNGGPQAAHNIIAPGGLHHTCSQFGSGALIPDVKTYLSRFMAIDPCAFQREREVLAAKLSWDPASTVMVEGSCPVVTPFHLVLNQARELSRGAAGHGTCGTGVGELRLDEVAGSPLLRVRDLAWPEIVRAQLRRIGEVKGPQIAAFLRQVPGVSAQRDACQTAALHIDCAALAAAYAKFYDAVSVVPDNHVREFARHAMVFEGAQGVLIDTTFGFAPYHSWTDTAFGNVFALLAGTGMRVTRVGVLRTYATRHGPGPFPTEQAALRFPDHNRGGGWQGEMRFGLFDGVLTRYAMRCVGGVDVLALNHVDQQPMIRMVANYRLADCTIGAITAPDTGLLQRVVPGRVRQVAASGLGHALGVPVLLEGHGPSASDRRWQPQGLAILPDHSLGRPTPMRPRRRLEAAD